MEFVLLIFAALLPAILLVHYILKKDKLKPEPKSQLIKGFFYGVGSAVLTILVLGPIVGISQDTTQPSLLAALLHAFCFAAIPEELAKFLMLWLLLRGNKYFDEHIDAVVYSVCVGMGFAGAENLLYLFDNYDSWISVGVARALISVPGHFFFAVAMGYYYSLAHFGDKTQRKTNLSLAIAVPVLMHGVFDSILFSVSIVPSLAGILTIGFILCFRKIRTFASGKIKELYEKDRQLQEIRD